MKVLSVIGARPQFIKLAVVSQAIENNRPDVEEIILHTGQHYDANMSQIFFEEMGIPQPDYNLGIGGGTHGENTGRMIEKIEHILLDEQPDLVIIYGDTDSTLAGAIAASKLHIDLAHIEAGLRSYNRRMPEEINRVLADHASDILYTPTATATQNLENEGISPDWIQEVGDVMYDATIHYCKIAENSSDILGQLNLSPGSYVLATIHRAENTNYKERLDTIIAGFSSVPEKFIWPLHPRTRKNIKRFKIDIPHNVTVIDPVGYLDMLLLEKNSRMIVTDSGGVQKEAYFQRVPCITLRNETEWTELVDIGVNRLVTPTSKEHIVESIEKFNMPDNYNESLFGAGNAGKRIALSI